MLFVLTVCIACTISAVIPISTRLPCPFRIHLEHLYVSIPSTTTKCRSRRCKQSRISSTNTKANTFSDIGGFYSDTSNAANPDRDEYTFECYIYRDVFNRWQCLCSVISRY